MPIQYLKTALSTLLREKVIFKGMLTFRFDVDNRKMKFKVQFTILFYIKLVIDISNLLINFAQISSSSLLKLRMLRREVKNL